MVTQDGILSFIFSSKCSKYAVFLTGYESLEMVAISDSILGNQFPYFSQNKVRNNLEMYRNQIRGIMSNNQLSGIINCLG